MTTTEKQEARLHLAPPRLAAPVRRPALRWLAGALVLALVVVAVQQTGSEPGRLVAGRGGAGRFLRGFLHPELSGPFLASLAGDLVETLFIAVAGLAVAVVLAVPLVLPLAGNVRAPRPLRAAAQLTAAVLRGVPTLLWALVFVATLGLGAAAGVYAVGLHGGGLLAKLGAEQLEGVDRGPVEAVRLTGASRTATALLAILPQARGGLVSLALYQGECNVRDAVVVGFVGAGGIGQTLALALRLFRYGELATLVLAVLVVVLGSDLLSRLVRRRLGAET